MQEQRPPVQQILVSLQRVSSRNKDEIHYHKATLNLQSSGRDKVRTTPAWSHIPSATSLSSDRHFPRSNSEQWSEVLHVSTVKSRGSVVTLESSTIPVRLDCASSVGSRFGGSNAPKTLLKTALTTVAPSTTSSGSLVLQCVDMV